MDETDPRRPRRKWARHTRLRAAARLLLCGTIVLLLGLAWPAPQIRRFAFAPGSGSSVERTAWVERDHPSDGALQPGRYFGVTAAVLGGAGIVLLVVWTVIERREHR